MKTIAPAPADRPARAAAGGGRGLQRVGPAPAFSAAGASCDGNHKAAYDGANFDIALDLLVDRFDGRRAVAAVRARLRRRHVDHLVRRRRLGHGAKDRRRAVTVPALAARLLGIGLGQALRKRGRLALAATMKTADEIFEFRDAFECRRQLFFQLGDPRSRGSEQSGGLVESSMTGAVYHKKRQGANFSALFNYPKRGTSRLIAAARWRSTRSQLTPERRVLAFPSMVVSSQSRVLVVARR